MATIETFENPVRDELVFYIKFPFSELIKLDLSFSEIEQLEKANKGELSEKEIIDLLVGIATKIEEGKKNG